MNAGFDGTAAVYCEGAFASTNGKTAHGLVRRTRRYRVLCVIDSTLAGRDAGEILDGKPRGIPLVAGLDEAIEAGVRAGTPLTHLVVGLAPDGGRLPAEARADIRNAVERGLHVDSGLHDFLSDDPALVAAAEARGVVLRDIRRPPERSQLRFFSGIIEEVDSFRIAVLGTDSALGKRTTAWILVDALAAAGHSTLLVGTGQTAWLQGAEYGVIMDCLVNDFVSGEIEHAVWRAWNERRPQALVIEGQGSLMNPAYPGGFEILAAARPHVVVLQHAPARPEYDGFPGYPIHPLVDQVRAVELIGGKPVVAVTVNHEGLAPDEIDGACDGITQETGLPAFDVLRDGGSRLAKVIASHGLAAGESAR